MKIDKAIKILDALRGLNVNGLASSEVSAIKLGIEALRRHQALQTNPYYTLLKPLPGETPEEKEDIISERERLWMETGGKDADEP